ncbi:ABC transporter permease [Paenibacillus guangzhouensis]|uniref:ABC transporter permease n=1 Tax=Paenibacillus guangzhouensis TaxID=1473112 RepID=UPI00126719B0|nr:ABC transporter permease [Paenibacillus guangzhouensis]
MNRNALSYLIKHELMRRRPTRMCRKWISIYAAIVAIILIGAYAFLHVQITFKPEVLLFIIYVFPYFAFMQAYMMVSREFKDGTHGWWLTLPYSRGVLLRSKYVAALIRIVQYGLLAFAATWAISVLSQMVQGNLSADSIFQFTTLEFKAYLAMFTLVPFMIGFGLFGSILRGTQWKPLLPLVWVIYGLSANAMSWIPAVVLNDDGHSFFTFMQMPITQAEGLMFVAFLALSFLAGGVFLWAAVKLMNRQLIQ